MGGRGSGRGSGSVSDVVTLAVEVCVDSGTRDSLRLAGTPFLNSLKSSRCVICPSPSTVLCCSALMKPLTA